MSKLRERIAALADDIGEQALDNGKNKWGKLNPMTMLLLQETQGQYWAPIENAGSLNEAKTLLLDTITTLNNQYADDPDFSHWSDAKIKKLKVDLMRIKHKNQLFNLITNSDYAGYEGIVKDKKEAALQSLKLSKIYDKLSKLASKMKY